MDLYFPFLCNPLLHFLSKYLCGETAGTSSYCTNTGSALCLYTHTQIQNTHAQHVKLQTVKEDHRNIKLNQMATHSS